MPEPIPGQWNFFFWAHQGNWKEGSTIKRKREKFFLVDTRGLESNPSKSVEPPDKAKTQSPLAHTTRQKRTGGTSETRPGKEPRKTKGLNLQ